MKKSIICAVMALGFAAPGLAFAASNDNEAQVYQNSYSEGNFAEISQEFASNRNFGSVDQSGSFNDAYITQEFSHDASGEIYQNGFYNYAEIWQHDGSNSAIAMIDQTLDDNTAYIEQAGSRGSYAEIIQNGFGNSADVYQGSANAGGPGNNFASVLMYGDDDLVVIDQLASTNGEATAYTEGGGLNEIWIAQAGFDNLATANVWNYGSTGNVVDIAQTGRLNDATGEVGVFGVSTDSLVTIIQEGNRNIAYASVDGGNGNDIYVDQFGNDNDAWAIANGDFNYVTISQWDNRNVATSESYGNENVVNIYQGGL